MNFIGKFPELKFVNWPKIILYGVIIAAIYHSALRQLVVTDWAKEDYSHCYLIPFVVLYLLWEKRYELIKIRSLPSWTGMIFLCLGLILFWLGELGGEFFTMYMSLWLTIVSIMLLHLGWEKIKSIWFAVIMMLAMFPFPHFVNVRISFTLKLISSQLGVWLLHLYGMSAYREGNIIDLGFTQLQVVDACSGLRYLISLMVLGLILAYWFKAPFWKKAVLFFSTIPITIFVNSFRIAATGVLYQFFGPSVAEGFFHDFSGWLIFMFTLGILLIEMWLLKKIGKESGEGMLTVSVKRTDNKPHPHPSPSLEGEEIKEELDSCMRGNDEKGWKGFLTPPQFVVALILLCLTLGVSQGVEFREKIPIKKGPQPVSFKRERMDRDLRANGTAIY